MDDPGAAQACLSADPTCGPLQSCGLWAEGVRCDCRPGYERVDESCISPCENDVSSGLNRQFFISPQGTDQPGCEGGSRTNPWASLRGANAEGCLSPGTEIVLLEGEYDAQDLLNGGTLRVLGTPESPIRIIGDPQSNQPTPARVNGRIFIEARSVELARIELRMRGDDGLLLAGEDLVVRDSFIHGSGGPGGSDCIKILGGGTLEGRAVRTLDFVDAAARQWCDSGGDGCSACDKARGPCARISYPTRRLVFENNLVQGVGTPAVRIIRDSEQIVLANNLYAEAYQFGLDDDLFELGAYPLESNSRIADPQLDANLGPGPSSPVIDAATDLGICLDGLGQRRDEQPDIGAIESR